MGCQIVEDADHRPHKAGIPDEQQVGDARVAEVLHACVLPRGQHTALVTISILRRSTYLLMYTLIIVGNSGPLRDISFAHGGVLVWYAVA